MVPLMIHVHLERVTFVVVAWRSGALDIRTESRSFDVWGDGAQTVARAAVSVRQGHGLEFGANWVEGVVDRGGFEEAAAGAGVV